jgi:hypothetical protein
MKVSNGPAAKTAGEQLFLNEIRERLLWRIDRFLGIHHPSIRVAYMLHSSALTGKNLIIDALKLEEALAGL